MRTLLLTAALCLVPSLAHAAEAPAAENSWYGWQPLVADLGAATVTGTALAIGGNRGVPFAATWFVAAPVVHAAHGRWGAAGGSLLTRTLVPLTAIAIARSGCDSGGGCAWSAGGTGLLVGMGIASVIDASLFSWEEKPKTTSVAVTPTAAMSSQGMTFGLAGAF